jgi:hypothetical protein
MESSKSKDRLATENVVIQVNEKEIDRVKEFYLQRLDKLKGVIDQATKEIIEVQEAIKIIDHKIEFGDWIEYGNLKKQQWGASSSVIV